MKDQPTILIIDDEASVRQSLAAYFDDLEWTVDCADDAEMGLKRLDKQTYDVAIVDMRLPGKDGNAFIREAKVLRPELKCIIHTGSKQYMLPPDLRNMGLTDSHVLLKPVKDMSIFLKVIEQLGVLS